MKRLFMLMLVSVIFGLSSNAVPAYPDVLTMQQPDGTQIRVRLYGDERGHYYTTENGEMLLETTDGFRYAVLSPDGSMQPGDIVSQAKRSTVDVKAQAEMRQIMMRKMSKAPAKHPYVNKPFSTNVPTYDDEAGLVMKRPPVPLPGLFPGSDFPTLGSPKVLVLMVQFLDVRFSSPTAPDEIRAQITQRHYKERGLTGSAYDYYCDASMEQFTPSFDVVGPITVPGTQAFYGANKNGEDIAPREMVISACDLIKGQVDFSQYDNNNDGFVDNVYVIYAGRGEASGGGANTIWPHSWVIPNEMSPVYNGVKLYSYACSNELMLRSSGLAIDGIGTFCHEFGHVLGLPDLYSTNYSADNHPGAWALMASGSYLNESRTPPTLAAWERSALGWLKPVFLEASGDYTLPASLLTTNQAYVISTHRPTEYFTLENRQHYLGDWDDRVPSWGMLVWHIDYNENVWNYNSVNNDKYHQYANIVEARGDDINNGYQMEDCFPSFGHHSLTNTTKPALLAWDKTPTDVILTSITEDGWDNDDDDYEPTMDVYFTALNRMGVKGIEADSAPTFITNGLSVSINNDTPAIMRLYYIDGRVAATGINSAVAPNPGIYIATCGKITSKVVLSR